MHMGTIPSPIHSQRSFLWPAADAMHIELHTTHLVAVVALYLCAHALPADDAQQLPALLLDAVDAVNRLHAAASMAQHGKAHVSTAQCLHSSFRGCTVKMAIFTVSRPTASCFHTVKAAAADMPSIIMWLMLE